MARQEPKTKTMKASEARQQWSQVLDQVSHGETRVLVEESGRPVAAIVSAGDLERLQQFESQRAARLEVLEESWAAFAGEDPADIEREVARAVAEAREEIRREQQNRDESG